MTRRSLRGIGLGLALVAGVGTTIARTPPASAQQASASIAGEYRGAIGNQHFVFTLTQAADGTLSGRLTAPDQGNATFAFDSVTYADGVLSARLAAIGAGYEGRRSDAGDSFAGTWSQGGQNIPLTLRRPGTAAAFTLAPRKIGAVAFEPCRTADGNTEGLCGTYSVYENRARRSGRKLALKIMVLPALSGRPAPDAFLPLAGGPGQSAIDAYTRAAYTEMIRKDRDVVLIDQRGTGGSAPLQCALRDPHSAQQALGDEILSARLDACRAQLARSADLTQYTTSIFAADLEEVRAALGYAEVDLFGGSYGTRAALEYLRRHGDHVRSIALEGIVAPTYRIPLAFSRALQGSIDRVLALCAADAACHKVYPNLAAEFRALLDRLDKQPASMSVQTPGGDQTITISRGMFVAALRPILYLPEAMRAFPMMVHNAYRGDFQLFVAAAAQMRGALDKALNRDMALAVVCGEDMASTTAAMIRHATAGTYLGDFQIGQYQRYCARWPHGRAPADFRKPIRSPVPALLISGALDPVTPPEMAAELAHGFPNSQTVIIPNGTHGTGSLCIDRMIGQFVASAGKVDTACAASIQRAPFLTGPP
jgi:pimeloyl-ACP methyl ester carboxylesterase